MKFKHLPFLLWIGPALAVSAQPKPNILWITIEDTSPEFIGCYGNKNAKTPVIDQLAGEGIRFTNAFSTGTVCSPSRTCLITGVKTYRTGSGHHRSNYALPAFIHGFPYYLKQAGYHTANNAKTDYNVANNKNFITDAWDESSAKAGWWNRKPGQPFFSVVNFNDSHQSRTMTDSYELYTRNVLDLLPVEDRIGDQDFEMPPFYRDSPEMRRQLARVYNSVRLTDNKIGGLLDRLKNDNLRDSTIIFFFADHGEGIPRGKTNGIDLGYRVPFVIWFPPMYAHLSPWGKHGISDELIDFDDLAATMVSLAGGDLPAHFTGRALMGNARKPPADHLVLSSDRSDNGIDMVRTVTDGRYVYSKNFMPFMPQARYIRYMEIGEVKQQMRKDLAENKLNDIQKSLFSPRPGEFLFDTEADPWETKNLIDDPQYLALTNKMRDRLREEILNARDVMLLPEYELAEISKTGNAYQYRLDEKQFPIRKIRQAAWLSGTRGKSTALEQIRLLQDPDKIVRYWAALGLRSQPTHLLKPFQDQLNAAMQDTYPPVAVTVAAIVFDIFKKPAAGEVLKKNIMGDNAETALMAINYLLYMPDKQPFATSIRKAHANAGQFGDANKGVGYKVKAACMDFLGILGEVPNNPAYAE